VNSKPHGVATETEPLAENLTAGISAVLVKLPSGLARLVARPRSTGA
jgi:hypothetical protein